MPQTGHKRGRHLRFSPGGFTSKGKSSVTRKYRDTDPTLYAAWRKAVNAQQKTLEKYGEQSAELAQALAVAESYWAQLQKVSKVR